MTTADAPGTGSLPEQWGRYRILKKLGRGGLGVVYLAHDPELNRLIALKVPLDSGGVESATRFLRGPRAAASLQHPNICVLHEVGVLDGVPYLALAYIDGGSLADRLRRGPCPPAEAAALARTVAGALAYAHERGVVHRDLKPANILLDRQGEPVLTDFAAAPVGTPAYMPPERLRGDGAGHERAGDVYGLGVVLYELLAGRPPFDAPTDDEPLPPSAHAPGLDPRLDGICLKAMARDPAHRYADMAAFAAALAPFCEAARAGRRDDSWSLPVSRGSGDTVSVKGAETTVRPARPSQWPWRLVALAAVVSSLSVASSYALIQLGYFQKERSPVARVGDEAPSAKAYVDRARAYLRADRRDEALTDCAAAVRLDPNGVAARLLAARVWHEMGRRDKELETYADAWNNLKPEAALDYADLARAALALDRADDAVRSCDEAARRDPNLADAFEVRARAWGRKGEKERAAADNTRAARLMTPHAAGDYLDRSILHELAGETDPALADADRALELAPRLPAALRQRGRIYRDGNDRDRAAADYREAVAALTPRYAADYFDRGWLYNELGDYGRAAEDLETALSLGLQSGEVRRELGHAYRALKDYAKAGARLDEAVRLLPADALTFGERAALSLAAGRPGDAAADYGRALSLGADDARTRAGRGDAYFQSEEYEKAAADYTRALGRTAATDRAALADLYDRRGVAFARLARFTEATADYDRAIENAPDDPVLYRNRAASRLRAGDGTAAEADVRKALLLQGTRPSEPRP